MGAFKRLLEHFSQDLGFSGEINDEVRHQFLHQAGMNWLADHSLCAIHKTPVSADVATDIQGNTYHVWICNTECCSTVFSDPLKALEERLTILNDTV